VTDRRPPRLTQRKRTTLMGTWTDRAACNGQPVDRFFPIPYGQTDDAKADHATDVEQTKRICGRCPVRTDCLDWAMGQPERHGIWGGLDEEERRLLHRKEKRRERVAAREAS
jgi:WhiB family redox-sensing transcriptional regulator